MSKFQTRPMLKRSMIAIGYCKRYRAVYISSGTSIRYSKELSFSRVKIIKKHALKNMRRYKSLLRNMESKNSGSNNRIINLDPKMAAQIKERKLFLIFTASSILRVSHLKQ